MRLGKAEKAVLRALTSGSHLKSHRHLDGTKEYALHDAANASSEPVAVATVDRLRRLGLVEGNMKFPAATYLLTAKGAEVAASLSHAPLSPVLSRLLPGQRRVR